MAEPVTLLQATPGRVKVLREMEEHPYSVSDTVDYPESPMQTVMPQTEEAVGNPPEITGAFDVRIENGKVRCYDSSYPENGQAGMIYYGYSWIYAPAASFDFREEQSYVSLVVTNDGISDFYQAQIVYGPVPETTSKQAVERIAYVIRDSLGKQTVSRVRPVGDITLIGRYV